MIGAKYFLEAQATGPNGSYVAGSTKETNPRWETAIIGYKTGLDRQGRAVVEVMRVKWEYGIIVARVRDRRERSLTVVSAFGRLHRLARMFGYQTGAGVLYEAHCIRGDGDAWTL